MATLLGILKPDQEVLDLGEKLIKDRFQERKFSLDDVTDAWHVAAEMWLYGLERQNFEFLDDIARKSRRAHDQSGKSFGECLTRAQAKGALNCWRAHVLGKVKEKNTNTPDKEKVPTSGPDLRTVPVHNDTGKGFFAVKDISADKMRFFRIDRPPSGRWADWVFVREQHGGNFAKAGAQRPGESYKGQAVELLAVVADEPSVAMKLYGQTLKRCGICNRELTDEKSRAYGIGPECRKKGIA